MAYVIIPGCTGPSGETLALAAANDGTITVQDASEITVNLLWSLVYDVTSDNFAMVNENSVEIGAPAVLSLATGGGGTSALTLLAIGNGLSALTTWDVAAGGNALAVRPTLSTSLNLNVSGAGPYPPGNPVIAYDGWGNGQPNEIWTFKEIGPDSFPWNYTFAPECNADVLLSANADDPGGQLTMQEANGDDDTAGPTQLWSGQYVINATSPLGAIFVNEELSMAMRTTPGGGQVFTVDPTDVDEWTAWRVGGAPDAGAWVVHSIGNDNLCLNVSGGDPCDPGSLAITYPWQGGADNEQWIVTYVPHEVTDVPPVDD